jgi:hypothetical protein
VLRSPAFHPGRPKGWDARAAISLEEGKPTRRKGWLLIIEVSAYIRERLPDSAAPAGPGRTEGRRIARYRLTERVTAEGHQVYEHIPD